jgi:co-chaperonin GroES (HSP10)
MIPRYDPETIRPLPGKIVVEIVEKQGGMSPGGLFIPALAEQRQHLKDTAICRILKLGPPGTDYFGYNKQTREWELRHGSRPIPIRLSVGDHVITPRDVPLVFVWDAKRYAIILQHEILAAVDDWIGEEIVPPRTEPDKDLGDMRRIEREVEEALRTA